jgi:hypothetical protein
MCLIFLVFFSPTNVNVLFYFIFKGAANTAGLLEYPHCQLHFHIFSHLVGFVDDVLPNQIHRLLVREGGGGLKILRSIQFLSIIYIAFTFFSISFLFILNQQQCFNRQIPGTNIGFPLGWQGIVPFKAIKMVAMSVDIILGRLVNMKVSTMVSLSLSLSFLFS